MQKYEKWHRDYKDDDLNEHLSMNDQKREHLRSKMMKKFKNHMKREERNDESN